MADLKLTADFTDLQTLKRELLDIPKKARDSARTFEAEFARAERILVKQARQFERNAQESQKFYSELLKLNKATKDAGGSAQVFVRELEKQERELDRLKTKYDPLYASSQLYERSLNEINLAHEKGAISAQRQIQLIDQLNAEYQAFAAGSTAATNRFVTAQAASSRGMNAMGVGMQQAGYQVGDFLVQVQSGTNWMVAFGQQATQLVGILPMFNSVMGISGTALVALSAGLGIAIPLLTAIGAAFLRTRQEADASADSIEDLESRLKSLDSTLRDYLRTREAARMGITVDELLGLEGLEDAEQRVEKAVEALAAAQEKLQSAGSGLGIVGGGVGFAVGAGRRAQEDYEAALANLTKAEDRLATLRQKQQEEQFKAFSERLLQYEEEIALQREIAEFGRNSAQVQKLEREQALAAEIRRINELEKAQEINEDQANILRESARILSEIEQTTKSAADEAKRFSDNLVLGQEYLANAVRAGVASGAIPPQALNSLPQTAGEKAYQDLMERRRKEYYANQNRESRSRGGGGRSGTPEFVSRVFGAELQKAIEQAQEDLRLYNQEVQMLDSALQAGLVTQQEYNSFVAQAREAYNQAQQGAYDYSSAMEQVESTAMRSMEGAFMSLIDGSKSASDAFRDMAREILSEAMRLLVIRPLINNLFGGGLGGGGGIFGGIFGRASGGSVMAGKPYLVGEHGPELVIPGRSGTVMNANLTNKAMGGGENVTVVNNFNFSANGDDSVKRIIAAEAPKIAALTQKQIVDQRRRGGQMRSVFG